MTVTEQLAEQVFNRARSGPGESVQLPGSLDTINHYKDLIRFLDRTFLALATLGVVILFFSGWIEVAEAHPVAGFGRKVLGGVTTSVPGFAVMLAGHVIVELITRRRLPFEDQDHATEVDEAMSGAAKTAIGAGAVTIVLATAYNVSHLVNLVEELGTDQTLGGVSTAWMISAAFEGIEIFALVAKMALTARVAGLVPRAMETLSEETRERLEHQQLFAKTELARLQGENEIARLQADANQSRRLALQQSTIEDEKFRAARKTQRAQAREVAAAELEIDGIDRQVRIAQARFDADRALAELDARQRIAALEDEAMLGAQSQMAALAETKVLDRLALEQGIHQKETDKARRKHRLGPGTPEPTTPKASTLTTTPNNGNGNGVSVNGTGGAS